MVTEMFTAKEIFSKITGSEESTIRWLKDNSLLKKRANCVKCGTNCDFVRRKGSYSWRCPIRGCQSILSLRDSSFFFHIAIYL